ncbi:cytochrome P450 [Streptomyces goshikiensis]|uniref:cytochrome P450 n=1 Tax=Streptomyces goshikiensis TaxID=1942 RepID=UPI003713C5FE
MAWHRDLNGALLDPRTATGELLDIIRPTVAIAWFATFAAHALHRWPQHRDLLRADTAGLYAEAFAHEVRRFYPVAPSVAGLAAQDLTWNGEHIPKDALVLLDLYGQNHDPALWEDPYRFDPRRFSSSEGPQDPLDILVPKAAETRRAATAAPERTSPSPRSRPSRRNWHGWTTTSPTRIWGFLCRVCPRSPQAASDST